MRTPRSKEYIKSQFHELNLYHVTDGVTEQDVKDLFGIWNDAILTQDPDTIARRYTSNAILLPTVSDIPHDTHALIEDYFVKFLAGEPEGEILESFVDIGHHWVSNVGIYEFTMATDGSKVRGRYSFVRHGISGFNSGETLKLMDAEEIIPMSESDVLEFLEGEGDDKDDSDDAKWIFALGAVMNFIIILI